MPSVPGLYVHIPYCAAKCPYCDFNSIAGRDAEHAAYVDALLAELCRLPRGPYQTIFIGGGTPSLLGPALLEKLLVGMRAHLHLAEDYEWTCEANPGSADAERFALLAAHGVNRVSLGVQSTHAHHLKFLGRVHDAAQAHLAIAAATRHFTRVNADLMLGLPDQTIAELDADLALYRQHGLRHASVYHLTYEPGTEFHAKLQRGELHEVDQDLSAAMLAHCRTRLAELGMQPYETSNFAAHGQACRHNLGYWLGDDYYAAGAGAVSTVGNVRLTRHKHPGRYIAAIAAGEAAIMQREDLSPAQQRAEAWMNGLRLEAPMGLQTSRLRALGDSEERWQPIVDRLADWGLIECDGDWLRITAKGRAVQDRITVELLGEVE